MGRLIIGDKDFECERLVNWHDNGWDATAPYCIEPMSPCDGPYPYGKPPANPGKNRYYYRPKLRGLKDPINAPYDVVRKTIRKFVLHHDGLGDSKTCWNVLQNERGLSCHFLIDNDGTIYQTCNLSVMAYHAAIFNTDSIGVEMCNRGERGKYPDFYAKRGDTKRRAKPCFINGHTIDAWDFTDEQYESMFILADRLRFALPDLPLEFPRDPNNPSKVWLETMGKNTVGLKGTDSILAMEYSGYIGHYHLTTDKWDPGPFDFKAFIDKLRGQRTFPVWSGQRKPDQDKPLVPNDSDALSTKIQELYDLNEKTANGGFFPVGPWGVTRLWHGGVHLPGQEGDQVFAPFPGRVVAARFGPATPIGSNNFVLLRHDMNVGGKPLKFWSLFMHLREEKADAEDAPEWYGKAASRRTLDGAVNVDGYEEPILAGAVLGHMSVVGPGDVAQAQIHFEIFSDRSLFKDDPDWDEPAFGFDGGRFCDLPAIDDLIDKDKDGRLSRSELSDFYAGGVVDDALRRIPTYNISEWNDEPPWREALTTATADMKKQRGKVKSPKDADDEDLNIDELVGEQLDPFIWWTDKVAGGLGLPSDGAVFHYHPVRFLEKINLKLRETGKGPEVDVSKAVSTEAIGVSDDSQGKNMFVQEDVKPPDDLHLELGDLVKGFAGDRPAPTKGEQ